MGGYVNRYVFASDEDMWVDTAKPWKDPEADSDTDGELGEELFEEVYPGEVMNAQDFELTALRARNAKLEKVVDELRVFVSVRQNWASLGAVIFALADLEGEK